MENKTLPRPELVQGADAIAHEQGIDKEEVFKAMEEAIKKSAKDKYGQGMDIRALIDRKTGAITLVSFTEVVADDAEIEEDFAEQKVPLKIAKRMKSDAKVGEFLMDELPPFDFGRMECQKVRQIIRSKLVEAIRTREYDEFKDRIGEIVDGTVKRIERDKQSNGANVIVEINREVGKAEALLKFDEVIKHEKFRPGDRVKAVIIDVKQKSSGHAPQIMLSRTHNDFLAGMFRREVNEIYTGEIEIRSVSRFPGVRAKMAVSTNDNTLDPVATCVGPRGERVRNVVDELLGEKIDIINWDEDLGTYIENALSPAVITRCVMDADDHVCVVVPDEDQKKIAIGTQGQNVKLASRLTEYMIDVKTEEEIAIELASLAKVFMDELDIDEVLARVLIDEGFKTVEEISACSVEDLMEIEAFDEEIAEDLKQRADASMEKVKASIRKLGVDKSLLDYAGLNLTAIKRMAEFKGSDDKRFAYLTDPIKTLEDFADASADEILEMIGETSLTKDEINDLIINARVQLGWIDPVDDVDETEIEEV
ncbi:MAG: transcription termination factor NusA [Alphaproteobacteria bacterium]|nr:transcription termination factor NusA [Alphaproteobacteria bacterium]